MKVLGLFWPGGSGRGVLRARIFERAQPGLDVTTRSTVRVKANQRQAECKWRWFVAPMRFEVSEASHDGRFFRSALQRQQRDRRCRHVREKILAHHIGITEIPSAIAAASIDEQTLRRADEFLADTTQPAALRRLISEGRADVARCLAARRVDRAAGQAG